MPSSIAQDGRVRTPVSLQEQLEHLHFHEAPARCRSPCCAPLTQQNDDTPALQHDQPPQRPALNRNAASHLTTSSAKSVYSTGTDSSCVQSEDGSALFAEFGDNIDTTTFEQVRISVFDRVSSNGRLIGVLDPRNGRR